MEELAEMDMDFIENGSITSPEGFLASGVTAGFKRNGAPDMAMVFSERPCSFSASFTSNLFPAAPVQLCRERVRGSRTVQAVTINSGVANACTGLEGYGNAVRTAEKTAEALKISADQVLIASTGRIGNQLPMEIVEKGVLLAAGALSRTGGADASRAIMTTDTRPKSIALSFVSENGKKVTIGGMCKGAGMIAPKMTVPHATMISCITTDGDLPNELLSKFLAAGIEDSFNKVTVDGDMSTNDSVFLLANGASGVRIDSEGSADGMHFKVALLMVMQHLARAMAMDGEGATKFVTVEVTGGASKADAEICARTIANSLLCKTAWFGCDPNWGRVLAAAGRSGAVFSPENVSLDYDDMPVVRSGMDAGTPEEELCRIMKHSEFSVKLNLGEGHASFTVWTSDISYEYVKINADYHT